MTLAATVILMFPMGFFLLSSPAFLMVKLDIPEVGQLLRGLFNAYFLMTGGAAILGTAAFASAGQWVAATGIASIAFYAFWARRWFLPRMDAQLRARDAGDGDAPHRLRVLHWKAMVSNAIQLTIIVSSIPYAVSA